MLLLALALVLASTPLGASGWGMRGSHEPDTVQDRTQGLMHLEPDHGTTLRKVYLNGWAGSGAAYPLSLNPNSAALGSAFLQSPYRAYAILGVWKDCNGDGYLGLGDNALFEYRALLLNRTDICPPGQRLDPRAHNDGEWVRELFPIGPDAPNGTNPYNVHDAGALVWADFKLPGERADPTCPLTPLPYGTLQRTGGLLRYADCQLDWKVTGTVNILAHAFGQDDLAFDDAPYHRPDQSRSPLNAENPYGQPSAEPRVSAFDCSQPPVVVHDSTGLTRQTVSDPTGGLLWLVFGADRELHVNVTDKDRNLRVLGAPPRSAPAFHDEGSLAGSVNETESALGDCSRSEAANCNAALHGGLDQHTGGDAYCLAEDDRPAIVREGRRQVDLPMRFVEGGARGDVLADRFATGLALPDDLGLAPPTRNAWFWVGDEGFVVSRNAFVNKDTLQAKPVTHITHYAYVSPTVVAARALSVPAATPSFYGAEWCARSSDPALNGGFVCDAAEWLTAARPGQPYQLRDVDCYDSSFDAARAGGLHWGALTDTACAR